MNRRRTLIQTVATFVLLGLGWGCSSESTDGSGRANGGNSGSAGSSGTADTGGGAALPDGAAGAGGSTNPPPPSSGAAHDYFEALIQRSDYWRGISFRPKAGDADNQSPYWEKQLYLRDDGGFQANGNGLNPPAISYSPETDTDPNRQDAAKVVVVAFSKTAITLTSPVTATDTVFELSAMNAPIIPKKELKLDDEILVVVSVDEAASKITVERAGLGTAAASHAAGTNLWIGGNTVRNNLEWPMDETHKLGGTTPLPPAEKISKFLLTWDCLWTDSYVGTGLTNHKSFNIETGDAAIWLEPNAGFGGGVSAVKGAFVTGKDVAAVYSRAYSSQLGPTVTDIEPLQPQLNTFTIPPNTWMRYWYLIDVIDIPSSFIESTSIVAAPIDAADSTITVDTTGIKGGFYTDGMYIKIDEEILQCVGVATTVSGTLAKVSVKRGLKGTSAAAHSTGAPIAGAHSMHVSAWVADENRDPVQLYDDLPLAPRASETNENAINDFIVEFNTSTEFLRDRYDRDLVAYVRNLVVLKAKSLDPVADGLLVRPVR